VNTYAYDPYGQTTASTGAINNPFGCAQDVHTATGQVKFGQRLDDPGLGRWSQRDSPDNRCGYVGANPVNAIDPSGLAGGAMLRLRSSDSPPMEPVSRQPTGGYLCERS
jgi:RHS repeat-associated protein